MLNTLPRTLIRGENGLYILPLFRSYAVFEEFRERFGKPHADKITSAFYGLRESDPDDYATSVGGLVQRQLLGPVPVTDVDRLGFKEVLWHRIPQRDWAAMFDFMDKAFDQPLYVLNQRDIEMASSVRVLAQEARRGAAADHPDPQAPRLPASSRGPHAASSTATRR